MNYQPFSAIAVGALFRDLDHSNLLLMKTSEKDKAVVMEGAWIDKRLYPRGSLVEMNTHECVVLLEGDTPLALPLTRVDPTDPRRNFWRDGDTRLVGRESRAPINVFAGLFLYSGFGVGHYFGALDQEVHWCNSTEAQARAKQEGVPFVFYDSFHWTSDPLLSRERSEAQSRIEAQGAVTSA